jgi:hypothetical protein
VLADTFNSVAIPYVVSILLPAEVLPARYNDTPDAPATVILPEPKLTRLIAVPVTQLTEVLFAIVKVIFDTEVE